MKGYHLLLLTAILFLGCLQPEEGSFTHEIEYRVSVTFGDGQPPEIDEIENLIVIVPLPILDHPIELRNLSIPEGWKAEVVETPYGEMLKLSGENVKTWVMKPMPAPVEPGSNVTPTLTMVKRAASYDFEVRLKLDREVNTLNPLNGEYVLKPKFNLEEVECQEEYIKHWKSAKCYSYTTPIYYESEPFVNASITVWLEGRNSWFQMGWTGNDFVDRILFTRLTGNGWHNATGRLETGQGVVS